MASQPKTCRTCSAPIYRRNRTGYCRVHVRSAPEVRQRVSEGVRTSFQRNPEQREMKRRAARIAANRPGERERRSRQAKERDLHKIGKAGWTAESLVKLGKSISNYRLAWCPPHLRDEYRHLTNSKGLPAPEARRMIEDLHEVEMQRWRREHGLVEVAALPDAKAANLHFPADMEFVDKVLPAVSQIANIPIADITGKSRFPEHKRPRYAAIYALKRHYGDEMSSAAIGKVIGRDHSTILYALKEAEKMARQDEEFAALVAEVLAA